jgi:hypothetical protein
MKDWRRGRELVAVLLAEGTCLACHVSRAVCYELVHWRISEKGVPRRMFCVR